MSFIKDLKFGRVYEDTFLQVFLGNPEDVQRPTGLFKAYDFIVKGVAYEVKSDRKTSTSGNLCIEAGCNGKPSGIMSTQADYYVYFVVHENKDYDCYVIPTEYIRDSITLKRYKRSTKGGDGWRSFMYLFDIGLFSQFKQDNGVQGVCTPPITCSETGSL